MRFERYYISLESYATDGSSDYNTLGALGTSVNYGVISYVDGDIWNHIYDLNKDGAPDIEIDGVGKSEEFTLKKTENCSVKESKITINLTEEGETANR